MDKLLKQFNKIKANTGTNDKLDLQKYLIFSGIIFGNGLFVLPWMKKLYASYFSNAADISHICYFDIDLEGRKFARIDIGLYGTVAPENINNFLHLMAKSYNKILLKFRNPKKTYENTKIFRLIPKYLIQMGDILNNDGTGHLSHYENNKLLKDEILSDITFCEAGVVAMANKGADTNGSQFFITLDEIPNLNNKYTIIGQTIKGFEQLKKLSALCGNRDGLTNCDVKISKTGIYDYKDYMADKKLKF